MNARKLTFAVMFAVSTGVASQTVLAGGLSDINGVLERKLNGQSAGNSFGFAGDSYSLGDRNLNVIRIRDAFRVRSDDSVPMIEFSHMPDRMRGLLNRGFRYHER